MAYRKIESLPIDWDYYGFGSEYPTEKMLELLHKSFDEQLPENVYRDGDAIFWEISDGGMPDIDTDEILSDAYDRVYEAYWQ